MRSHNRVKPEQSVFVTLWGRHGGGTLVPFHLRTTGLEPVQGVLPAPASGVAQRCSQGSRASILQVVDGLPTSTPDGSGPMPQVAVIPL